MVCVLVRLLVFICCIVNSVIWVFLYFGSMCGRIVMVVLVLVIYVILLIFLESCLFVIDS